MTLVAAVLGFVAVWSWWGRGPRLSTPSEVGRNARLPGDRLIDRTWVRYGSCVIGAAVVGGLVGGALVMVVAALGGAGVARWIGTLESAAVVREREQVARDLPMAAELLAACALVGAPIDRSLGVVADALGGPLAAKFRVVMTRLELGADPATEWRRVESDPNLAALARTLLRALESGAPPADGLSRLAMDRRREQRGVLLGRARAVGVKTAGPLAACFLPAFMLVGVVPIVVGVFSQLGL